MAELGVERKQLLELFAQKASNPPPEASLLLVKHLACKESRDLANAVSEAIHRHVSDWSQRLPPPTEMLPPLG